MATKPPKRPRVPRETRAQVAAKVLVEGKSKRRTAKETGVSRPTVSRIIQEHDAGDVDLVQYVQAYRARALPRWLGVLDKATDAAMDALEGAEGRDVAAVVKAFSDLTHRAVGEADVRHEHAGSIDGARDALAARIAAIADSKPKG